MTGHLPAIALLQAQCLENGCGIHGECHQPEDEDIARARIDDRKEQKQCDHHGLSAEYPCPTAAHRKQGITVHDKAGDEFETPWNANHCDNKPNVLGTGAVDRHPSGYCKIEKANGNTLTRV
jgi:hypothetical protein